MRTYAHYNLQGTEQEHLETNKRLKQLIKIILASKSKHPSYVYCGKKHRLYGDDVTIF